MVNIVNLRRLTNKQLRLYLRQEGLMVSGNKAQLVERILKHADGSVARTFDEDIELMMMKTCPPVLMMIPQVILRRSQPSMKVVHQATITDVERSFQVLFIDDADIPEVV